jgi:hypothetical protein
MRARTLPWLALLLICLPLLVSVPGCGGCRSGSETAEEAEERKKKEEEEKKRKEEELKKEPYELGPLATLPLVPSGASDRDKQTMGFWYKPGHWTSTTMPGKANKEDFVGELEEHVLDGQSAPMHLEALPFDLATTREISMPKGQPKTFESLLYFPVAGQRALADCRGKSRQGGRQMFQISSSAPNRMPSYQYHFVVISDVPERYNYLEKLDSVRPPWKEMSYSGERYYLISLVQPQTGRRTLLPSYALLWTSTAYVLWDDADPTGLSDEQQTALVDWLHWGGQLILSGPKTLETLQTSFLKDYLPAVVPTDAPASRKLTKADFAEVNRRWTLRVHGAPGRPLSPVQAWESSQVKKHPEARFVPGTGDLLVERRIGRGRVVASLFRLVGSELTGWKGFDGFFNACLLDRPPRKYSQDRESSLQLRWTDPNVHRLDAAVACGLRYFTRDTGLNLEQYGVDALSQDQEDVPGIGGGLAEIRAAPGVAAWNDYSSAAKAARESLANSARIEIPSRTFVVWVVAAYLLVLVPANWAVFRAIGRVEWAWAAAPAIAVLCTVVVIRLAQLDIGFARSVTEIGVLELQGDYSRGHMTRYTALYTSLSTGYDLRIDDPGGQVQPFRTKTPEEFRLQLGEGYKTLAYRHGSEVTLPDFRVQSNSTQFLHSEHMVAMEGPVALKESLENETGELVNRSGFVLHDAGIVRRTESGRLETAWLGNLDPGAQVPVRFDWEPGDATGGKLWDQRREQSPVTAANPPPGELNLRRLLEIAQDPAGLRPGGARLIAWTDAAVPGLTIDPAAPQARRATLVVAHLRYGLGRDPQPDANCRAEIETEPTEQLPP